MKPNNTPPLHEGSLNLTENDDGYCEYPSELAVPTFPPNFVIGVTVSGQNGRERHTVEKDDGKRRGAVVYL